MAFMAFLLSMIVKNLYVVWAVLPPFKANTAPIAGKIHQIFDAGGTEYL
jgi:hypothetical protein